MKSRKKLLGMLLIMAMVLMSVFVITACPGPGSNIPTPGPESGTYVSVGGEHRLTLDHGDLFALAIQGEERLLGQYDFDYATGNLRLSFNDNGISDITATLSNEEIHLDIFNRSFRLLKQIPRTVSFNSAPGTPVASLTVVNGNYIPVHRQPSAPMRDGHRFVGWTRVPGSDTLFNFGTDIVESNITLHARWAEPRAGQAEFDIDFDWGIAGIDNPARIQTIGGRIHSFPATISRPGYAFGGWFVSMTDVDGQLSYRVFTNNTMFAEATRLQALWTAVAAGGVATPVFSIDRGQNRITIEPPAGGPPVGHTHRIWIFNPAGQAIISNEIIDTGVFTYNFTFTNVGDYRVQLIAMVGGAASGPQESNFRIYRNRGLARVSNFSVVNPSVLLFNDVGNAANYRISVYCGQDGIRHRDVNLGRATSFNFASWEMRPGGIIFRVEASAPGFVSSEGIFEFDRVLGRVTEINFDWENQVASWTDISNAESYVVSMRGRGITNHPVQHFDIDNQTSFSFRDLNLGDFEISVRPETVGYNSPAETWIPFTKHTIASPSNVRLDGYTIRWDRVQYATGYTIYIGGQTIDISGINNTSYVLGGARLAAIRAILGSYELYVRANAANDSLSSLASYPARVRNNMFGAEITYARGSVHWYQILGASEYAITINPNTPSERIYNVPSGGGNVVVMQQRGTSIHRSYQAKSGISDQRVMLSQSGDNIITFMAMNEARQPMGHFATRVNVFAYTVTFDVGGLTEIAAHDRYRFIAFGDPVDNLLDLSGVVRGHDFDTWYLSPGGSRQNAMRFRDRLFGGGDMVLFANWVAHRFNISLQSGRGTVENTTAVVEFGTMGVIEVPADDWNGFVGWYTAAGGAGTRVTNERGVMLAPWDAINANGMQLYAFYANLLTFIREGTAASPTYTVRAGPDASSVIHPIQHLVIPCYFNGYPVAAIDSLGRANLLTITLGSRVTRDALANTDGLTAFDAAINLSSIFVHENNRELQDIDGVVFNRHLDVQGIPTAHDRTQLVRFPIGRQAAFNIPITVNTISAHAFRNQRHLAEIGIPASVHTIEAFAFANIDPLTTIYLSPGLATIADNAFSNLPRVVELVIPAGVQRLGRLDRLVNLERVTFRGNVNNQQDLTLADGVFANSPILSQVIFDDYSRVINIPSEAFLGSRLLREIHIPTSVMTIGSRAFEGAATLERVLIGQEGMQSRLATLGADVFLRANALREVSFLGTASLEALAGLAQGSDINSSSFANHPSLQILNLPGNIGSIQPYALANIENLSQLTFGETTCNTVTTFAENALTNLPSLTSITIPARSDGIIGTSFSGIVGLSEISLAGSAHPALLSVHSNVLYNAARTTLVLVPNSRPVSVVNGLGTFVIHHTVQTIGTDAFYKLNDVAAFAFTEFGSAHFTILDGILLQGSHLVRMPPNRNVTDVLIPAHITHLRDSAFSGNQYIRTVTFADDSNLVDIGRHAFSVLPSIAAINLGLRSRLERIGAHAFDGNIGLRGFSIPRTVDYIGIFAFRDVVFDYFRLVHGTTSISDSAFENIGAETVILPYTLETIGVRAFANANINNVVFERYLGTEASGDRPATSPGPDSIQLTAIGNEAFRGSRLMRMNHDNAAQNWIMIPEGVTSIGEGAFRDIVMGSAATNSFTQVRLPGSLMNIGSYAFMGSGLQTNGLSNITIIFGAAPNAGTANLDSDDNDDDDYTTGRLQMGSHVFAYMRRLNNVEFEAGANITRIGDFAFANSISNSFANSNFTSIAIPNTIRVIGNSAFYGTGGLVGNFGLTTVSFEAGSRLHTIGANAFRQTSLVSLNLPDSLVEIGAGAFRARGNQNITLAGTLSFGPNLRYIGDEAFFRARSLRDIVFYQGGTPISNQVAGGPEYTSPQLYSVGARAFFGARINGLVLRIPYSLEIVGTRAFEGVAYGTNSRLFIPTANPSTNEDGVIIDDWRNFSHSEDLTGPRLQDSRLTSVGPRAFSPEEDPTWPGTTMHSSFGGDHTLHIPGTVESLGYGAFSSISMTGILSVNLTSMHTVGVYDPDAGQPFADAGFLMGPFASRFSEIRIVSTPDENGELPDVSIPRGLFAGLRVVTIYIAANVVSIGEQAFGNGRGWGAGALWEPYIVFEEGSRLSDISPTMLSIRVAPRAVTVTNMPAGLPADQMWYAFRNVEEFLETYTEATRPAGAHRVVDGVLFNYAGDTLIRYPIGRRETVYTIPSRICLTTNTAIPDGQTPTGPYSVVTTIGPHAFGVGRDRMVDQAPITTLRLTTVNIPNSVTTIGQFAFQNARVLTYINIDREHSNLVLIDNFAFYNNFAIRTFTIPDRLLPSGISLVAFRNTNIEFVNFTSTRTDFVVRQFTLEDTAGNIIMSIGNIVLLVIPLDWTYVPGGLFTGRVSIQSVQIHAGVTEIRSGAFENAVNLNTIIFDEGSTLTRIGSRAFYNTNLGNITIPASVEIIDSGAFASGFNYNTVSNVTFEADSQLRYIGARAFRNNNVMSFNAVGSANSFPDRLDFIGSRAFGGGPFLPGVLDDGYGNETRFNHVLRFPASLEVIADWAFAGVNNTTDAARGVIFEDNSRMYSIGWGAFFSFEFRNGNLSFGENSSLQHIGLVAFGYFGDPGAATIPNVHLPDGLVTLSLGAFTLRRVAAFHTTPNSLNFNAIDGVLYSRDGTTLIQYPERRNATGTTATNRTYVVQQGVTTIASNAFLWGSHDGGVGRAQVAYVRLPNSVTSIHSNAFTGEQIVYVPLSVRYVQEGAFNLQIYPYGGGPIANRPVRIQGRRGPDDLVGWHEHWNRGRHSVQFLPTATPEIIVAFSSNFGGSLTAETITIAGTGGNPATIRAPIQSGSFVLAGTTMGLVRDVVFTATPAQGFIISRWILNGEPQNTTANVLSVPTAGLATVIVDVEFARPESALINFTVEGDTGATITAATGGVAINSGTLVAVAYYTEFILADVPAGHIARWFVNNEQTHRATGNAFTLSPADLQAAPVFNVRVVLSYLSITMGTSVTATNRFSHLNAAGNAWTVVANNAAAGILPRFGVTNGGRTLDYNDVIRLQVNATVAGGLPAHWRLRWRINGVEVTNRSIGAFGSATVGLAGVNNNELIIRLTGQLHVEVDIVPNTVSWYVENPSGGSMTRVTTGDNPHDTAAGVQVSQNTPIISANTRVNFVAIPNVGYRVRHWTFNGEIITPSEMDPSAGHVGVNVLTPYLLVRMANTPGPIVVGVVFEQAPNMITVNFEVEGAQAATATINAVTSMGHIVNTGMSVNRGWTVTFALDGWISARWYVNNQFVETVDALVLVLTDAAAIAALNIRAVLVDGFISVSAGDGVTMANRFAFVNAAGDDWVAVANNAPSWQAPVVGVSIDGRELIANNNIRLQANAPAAGFRLEWRINGVLVGNHATGAFNDATMGLLAENNTQLILPLTGARTDVTVARVPNTVYWSVGEGGTMGRVSTGTNPAGGTVIAESGNTFANSNTILNFTAHPNIGMIVAGWTLNGVAVVDGQGGASLSADNSILTLAANRIGPTVVAVEFDIAPEFRLVNFSVVGSDNAIIPMTMGQHFNSGTEINYGWTIHFVLIDPGYALTRWYVNNVFVVAGNGFTHTSLTENITVRAEPAMSPYRISREVGTPTLAGTSFIEEFRFLTGNTWHAVVNTAMTAAVGATVGTGAAGTANVRVLQYNDMIELRVNDRGNNQRYRWFINGVEVTARSTGNAVEGLVGNNNTTLRLRLNDVRHVTVIRETNSFNWTTEGHTINRVTGGTNNPNSATGNQQIAQNGNRTSVNERTNFLTTEALPNGYELVWYLNGLPVTNEVAWNTNNTALGISRQAQTDNRALQIPSNWPGRRDVHLARRPIESTVSSNVTFNLNGGENGPSNVTGITQLTAAQALPEPTRAGHDFAGWYTAQIGGQRVSFPRQLNGEITIWARWTPRFDVTFNINGGVGGPSNLTSVTSITAAQAMPNPTREAHVFAGWYTAQTGGTRVNFPHVLTANVTLWARWAALSNVTFDLNGGEGGPQNLTNVFRVDAFQVIAPTRAGHNFVGWFTQQEGGTQVTFPHHLSSDTIIWARWSPIFEVTFNLNGGIGGPQSVQTHQLTAAQALPEPTKEGSIFIGWYTEQIGGTRVSFPLTITDNTTLWARWQLGPVRVFIPHNITDAVFEHQFPSWIPYVGTRSLYFNMSYCCCNDWIPEVQIATEQWQWNPPGRFRIIDNHIYIPRPFIADILDVQGEVDNITITYNSILGLTMTINLEDGSSRIFGFL